MKFFFTFGTENTDIDGPEQTAMINNPVTPANAWLYRHDGLLVRQDLTNKSTRGNASGTFLNRTKSCNYSVWLRNDFDVPITFTSGNVFIGVSSATSQGGGAVRTDVPNRLQFNGNVGAPGTVSRCYWAAGAGLDPTFPGTSTLMGGGNPAGQPTNSLRPWGASIPITVAGGGSITLQPGQVYRVMDISLWNQNATTINGGMSRVIYDAGQGTSGTTYLTNGSTIWRPSGVGTTNTPISTGTATMVDAIPFPPQAQVGLGCFFGNPNVVPLTFEFRRPGTTETLFSHTLMPTGFSTIYVPDPPFASGTWNIACVGKTFLRQVKPNILINQFGQVTNFFLVNGDADGDNETTNADYALWAAANGSAPGDSNWDDRADFDWDGEITTSDYSAWANCQGQLGDL